MALINAKTINSSSILKINHNGEGIKFNGAISNSGNQPPKTK